MECPQSESRLAIGSMVWSVVVGAGLLVVLRFMQLAAGSGHASAFPPELIACYAGVELLLSLVLFGVLRERRWTSMALSILLVATALMATLGVRGGGWAPDFPPIALGMEGVWLAPWVLTACVLWLSRRAPR